MLALLKRSTLFVALVIVWALLLWFVIRLELPAHSFPVLLALHLLPPCLAYGLGWYVLVGRKKRQEKEALQRAKIEREEQARQEQLARARHIEELARRRVGADCLAVAISGWLERGGAGAVSPGAAGVTVLALDGEPEFPDEDGLGEAPQAGRHLAPYLVEAMQSLYSSCPGAMAFPVLVQGPAELAADDCCALVREALPKPGPKEAGDAVIPDSDTGLDGQGSSASPGRRVPSPRVSVLPAGGTALADILIQQFEQEPELPGLVVLAFDSPWCRWASRDEDDELSAAERERRQWHGAPAQGVVAMAVVNPRLSELLTVVEESLPKNGLLEDSYTTYWERGIELSPLLMPLAYLPIEARKGLSNGVPLATLHRSQGDDYQGKPGRSNELGNAFRLSMERAMVNGGLLPWPYGAVSADPSEKTCVVAECDWLVHNAGGIDCSGPRLAAVGLALHCFDINLNPIDEATNFPAKVGDLGQALPMALLAQAVNKTAASITPTCWVQFSGESRFDLGFIVPFLAPEIPPQEAAA